MRILTVITVVAATAVSGSAAFAQTGKRISDIDFIRANRCASLAAATGAGNAASFTAVVDQQGRGRADAVVDMATKAAERAADQVQSANDQRRASLRAELDGACQKFVG